jgi:phosphotransferase system enzyme I (PtsI)
LERVLNPEESLEELKRFQTALTAAEADLKKLKAELGNFTEFVDFQLELLKDSEVLKATQDYIRERGRNAEFAYLQVMRTLAGPISTKAPFFRERMADIQDATTRVLRHLMHEPSPSLGNLKPGSILLAHDLPPSEAARLSREEIAGVAIELGGKTSHTAIMARALEIPAVVGVSELMSRVSEGAPLILDGNRGLLILNPSPNRQRFYLAEAQRLETLRRSLEEKAVAEPVTKDGKEIDLSANIEFLTEVAVVKRYGAKGIGLFRTEYLYLLRRRAPTEEEQFQVFSEVARRLAPYPVIIRTFDLGGDKLIPGYQEANPFLGWRAIRFCLDNPEFFIAQLRAILRASSFGNLKVMFPMIASLSELRRAKFLLNRVKEELLQARIPFDPELQVGIMVETPSAAILAPALARECDFFSIGTNDLTQYTLAVDRANERVASLYDHFHPAVLRLIKETVDAGHERGIWVGVCGELSANPLGIPLLLGMGVDELSVSPLALPEAKEVIRATDTGVAVQLVERTLNFSTPVEVSKYLKRELPRRLPDLADFIFAERRVCLI